MSFKGLVDPKLPWNNLEIFAESVPHFLHQDLALLWMLERERQVRPARWNEKIDSWKRLVELFVLGKLSLDSQRIPAPLSGYTDHLDLQSLVLARCDKSHQPIAVLSPVVLLRGLPDPRDEELLIAIPATPVQDRVFLPGLLGSLVASLEGSGSDFGQRLAAVIKYEFRDELATTQPIAISSVAYKVKLLQHADRTLYASQKGGRVHRPAYVETAIQLFAKADTPTLRLTCATCGTVLTSSNPVVVLDEAQVVVPCGSCHNDSPFDLERLFIWRKSSNVYVWMDRENVFPAALGPLPPRPTVEGIEVQFEWPNLFIGTGQPNKLTLQFPHCTLQTLRFDNITYRKLLVPGDLNKFAGLPLRPAWLHLLKAESPPVVKASGDDLEFRNLTFYGVPKAFDRRWPSFLIKGKQTLQLGCFPKQLHSEWKRYRFFLGGDAEGYKVGLVTQDSKQLDSGRSDRIEVKSGWPPAVYVESESEADTGATWLLKKAVPPAPIGSTDLYIGIDFGTTQSVVYYGYPATSAAKDRVFMPKDIAEAADIIAGIGPPKCVFLPDSAQSVSADPALIPSAIWTTRDALYSIRWRKAMPPDLKSEHGFKWDQPNQSKIREYRRMFLDELLFLTLGTLACANDGQSKRIDWRIGFAYPLAFSRDQRSTFSQDLKKLRESVLEYAPGNAAPDFCSLNESYACVRAFGHPNPNEQFLLADLGGGTLDVDLFTARSAAADDPKLTEHHQVGSVRIGGELYVKKLTKQLLGYEDDDQYYWRVRDAVESGTTTAQFPGERAVWNLAGEYLPIPLEVIRFMAAAHLEKHPGIPLQFLLVGNGWKLARLMTSQVTEPAEANRILEEYISSFGLDGLVPMSGPIEVDDSKHLVALGALRNARVERRKELETDAKGTKMPAGIPFVIRVDDQSTSVSWYQLLGDAGEPVNTFGYKGENLAYTFDRAGGPPPPKAWQLRLRQSLPRFTTVPTDRELAEQVKHGIVPDRAERSPLVIVIEENAQKLGEQHAGAAAM